MVKIKNNSILDIFDISNTYKIILVIIAIGILVYILLRYNKSTETFATIATTTPEQKISLYNYSQFDIEINMTDSSCYTSDKKYKCINLNAWDSNNRNMSRKHDISLPKVLYISAANKVVNTNTNPNPSKNIPRTEGIEYKKGERFKLEFDINKLNTFMKDPKNINKNISSTPYIKSANISNIQDIFLFKESRNNNLKLILIFGKNFSPPLTKSGR